MVGSYQQRAANTWRILKSCAAYFASEKPVRERLRRRFRRSRFDYWESPWGRMLQDENVKDPSTREGKDFRRRFRVPFPVFCKLVMIAEDSNLFDCALADGFGRRAAPVELKILGILRILGRGWCMDDVSESTGISEETIRRSFHTFNKMFTTKHYEEYVYIPQGDDLRQTMRIYDSMGLTGCIGSMDGVHKIWDKCPVALTNLCKGKEKVTTLVYNATVNHHGRIQACTKSFWGARNDKTIVRYDKHIMNLKNKVSYDNIDFDLHDEHGITTKCRGRIHHQILIV